MSEPSARNGCKECPRLRLVAEAPTRYVASFVEQLHYTGNDARARIFMSTAEQSFYSRIEIKFCSPFPMIVHLDLAVTFSSRDRKPLSSANPAVGRDKVSPLRGHVAFVRMGYTSSCADAL